MDDEPLTTAAAPVAAAPAPAAVNAFEWLAGGLFFGNINNNNPSHRNKRALQTIESTKDVKQLWNGVGENFEHILNQQQQQQHDNHDNHDVTTTTTTTTTMAVVDATAEVATAESAAAAAAEEQPLTASDLLSARLTRLRFLLYEERKMTSSGNFRFHTPPHVAVATAHYWVQHPTQLPLVLKQMTCLPFESRKVMTHIVCYLLVAGLDGPDADLYKDSVTGLFCVEVVLPQWDVILGSLLDGYQSIGNKNSDVCLHCGSIYRSLIRHAVLYQHLVGTTPAVTAYVFPFLDTLVHSPNFDVASDAMECLRLVLTPPAASHQQHQHPEMADLAADFMTRDYVELWEERFVPKLLFDYNNPDNSSDNKNNNEASSSAVVAPNSYMTKRVALQILSQVLLTRSNYNVMVRFVASARNLKVVLLLLRHTSPHITLDAFHVFKVFVANPNKPPEVVKMLKDNQVKLCAYLKTLHTEKANADAQFRDEKALIIATIEAL